MGEGEGSVEGVLEEGEGNSCEAALVPGSGVDPPGESQEIVEEVLRGRGRERGREGGSERGREGGRKSKVGRE